MKSQDALSEESLSDSLDLYLGSEGKPSKANARRWRMFKNNPKELYDLLDRTLEENEHIVYLYHIANIGALNLPKNKGREIVINVINKFDSLGIDASIRHLLAKPLSEVAIGDDIRLLESFRDPIRSGVDDLVKKTLMRLSEESETPSFTPKDTYKTVQPTSDPTFAKKPPTSEKKPAKTEVTEPSPNNPFPYWIFIIGGVVVVGLVVVLKRK